VTALDHIRNVSIIAHIDHGKSTLADRLLELTGAVEARDMRAQYLDTMDIERERGITIKAQNVRLEYRGYVIHIIDTPGHVDFGYEVSRSLAACEGVILLVDSSQGIEAQTLANAYQAVEHDLTIVPALNKIDLPAAEPERRADEIERVLGLPSAQTLRISAKTGEGVAALLDAVIERVPAPVGDPDAPLQALIFDSFYDTYRGVVSAVRVFNGVLRTGARLRYVQAGENYDADEVGVRLPVPTPVAMLGPGEVGYLITGVKDVGQAKVGETVTDAAKPAPALEGYREAKPMVFCGLYPADGDDSPTCATRSRGCSSTTRRSPTSRRRRARSGSGSAAGSWACCTWRSSASGSNANTGSHSSPPHPTSSTARSPPTGASRSSTTLRRCHPQARSNGSRSRSCG
jgi:small GTP-binding protein domain